MGRMLRAGFAVTLGVIGLTLAPSPADAVEQVTVTGIVTDQYGEPVEGATIEAAGRYGAGPGDYVGFGSTTSGPDGRYTLVFDPYREDAPVAWADELRVELDSWHRVDLPDYEPGGSYTVDLQVVRDPRLSGTVTDESGAPVAGATVQLHNVATEDDFCDPQYGAYCWHDRALTTDADGRYATVLDPGDLVTMRVEKEGYATEVVEGVTGGAVDVQLSPLPPADSPPAAPTDVDATAIGPRRARVTFTAGTAAVLGFRATCVSRGGLARRAPGDASPIVVRNLAPGRRYHCSVRARNEHGWSAPSAYSSWFRAPLPRR